MVPHNITFLDTYIEDGNKAIYSLRNFYQTILIKDTDNPDHIFRIPLTDFFITYRRELESIVQDYMVNDAIFYQPKRLSMELYDTTEFWLALMRLNGMRNVTEFNQLFIKVYNPTELKQLINIFFKRKKIIV